MAASTRTATLLLIPPHSTDVRFAGIETRRPMRTHQPRRRVSPRLTLKPAKTGHDANMDYDYCVYDSDISTGYGLGAFFFLMASQVLIMIASRCFCCGQSLKPNGSRACAVILFIICWLTFLIAEICLLAGSAKNAYHTRSKVFNGLDKLPSCETLRKGVFAAGAAFTLITAILSELYYVCYSKARGPVQAYGGESGVGMGAYK